MISVCLSELYYKAVWGCWWWTGKVPVVCRFDNSKEVVEKHWGCSLPVCFGEAVSGSGGGVVRAKHQSQGKKPLSSVIYAQQPSPCIALGHLAKNSFKVHLTDSQADQWRVNLELIGNSTYLGLIFILLWKMPDKSNFMEKWFTGLVSPGHSPPLLGSCSKRN